MDNAQKNAITEEKCIYMTQIFFFCFPWSSTCRSSTVLFSHIAYKIRKLKLCCFFLILRQIKKLVRKGFPRKREHIISSVQKFLMQNPRPNPFKANRPGEGWCLFLFTALYLMIPDEETVQGVLFNIVPYLHDFLRQHPMISRKDQWASHSGKFLCFRSLHWEVVWPKRWLSSR
jgi:hypothetical protein